MRLPFFTLFLYISISLGVTPLFIYAEEEVTTPSITLTADTFIFTIPLDQIETWRHTEFISSFQQNYISEWEDTQHCPLPLFFCDAFLSERQKITQKIVSISDIQTKHIEQYLTELKRKVDRQATKSSLLKKDTPQSSLYTFIKGTPGLFLSWEENISLLEAITRNPSAYLLSPVPLILQKTSPPLSQESQELGIQELLGRGSSDFTGSSNDRIFNIIHALKQFDSILIAPGETFSFTKALGPVEEWTGYRPELVIRNNKTEPEYGGGICQVSTTFFRAAVNTGLEIIARRNHSYPVHYYLPTGFDATVYYPNPDLKIRNNFSHNILFVPFINEKQLVFEIYGTSDKRTVSVTEPIITEKNENGSLKTLFTQTVLDEAGNVLLEDTFKSTYDSPDNYPHPEDVEFTSKPKDWSQRQWRAYKKEKGL